LNYALDTFCNSVQEVYKNKWEFESGCLPCFPCQGKRGVDFIARRRHLFL